MPRILTLQNENGKDKVRFVVPYFMDNLCVEKHSFSIFPPYAIQQELAFKSNQQFRTIRLIEKNIALHFASVQASKSVFPVNKVLQHSPLVLISEAEKGFP